MNKMTMLDFFEDHLERVDFIGDLNLNWDKENHVFEIELVLEGQLPEELELEDESDVDQRIVHYDDAVLFYDQTRLNGEDYADSYVTTIPFSGKKGISLATAMGFFDYFQDFLTDASDQFLDFLDPNLEVETFTLEWDQEAYMQAIMRAAARLNDPNQILSYPKY